MPRLTWFQSHHAFAMWHQAICKFLSFFWCIQICIEICVCRAVQQHANRSGSWWLHLLGGQASEWFWHVCQNHNCLILRAVNYAKDFGPLLLGINVVLSDKNKVFLSHLTEQFYVWIKLNTNKYRNKRVIVLCCYYYSWLTHGSLSFTATTKRLKNEVNAKVP